MAFALVFPISETEAFSNKCWLEIEDGFTPISAGGVLYWVYYSETYKVCSDGSRTLVKDPYQ